MTIELQLFGAVGEDFTASSVAAALRDGGPVHVTINSGGGYAAEGAAIYSLLVAHPEPVDVAIIGIAASAASLVAMAGRRIVMRSGAVMMIHDPLNITIGNSADHARTIEQLEAYARAYARIYAARTGKTPIAMREMMKAESWFDGPEAVAAGFATATDDRRAEPFASFDYGKYRHGDRAVAGANPSRASWKRVFAEMKPRPGSREIHWVR